jgi:hypothetical protein
MADAAFEVGIGFSGWLATMWSPPRRIRRFAAIVDDRFSADARDSSAAAAAAAASVTHGPENAKCGPQGILT